uniref:Uncharacterized protein n=1 Tax=Solanum tuberosum TaxID=4113 RepID=M1DVU3_SOLTU
MAQRAQLNQRQQHYSKILSKIRNLIDVAAGLKIEDENDLVQALKDDLLSILKVGDSLQGLVEKIAQLHINHARDYAPLMALIEDVKSICQSGPAILVVDQVHWRENRFREGARIEESDT